MDVQRIGPVFGAQVTAIDLGAPLADNDVAELAAALAEHEVLVFPDQAIGSAHQVAFGSRFGDLLVSPFSPNADDAPELMVLDNHRSGSRPLTDIWHSDETFRAEPPMATVLRACIVPELGGTTMFASMRAAYEGLTERMKTYISGLTANHGFGRFDRLFDGDPEQRKHLHQIELRFPHPHHPVVRVHPVTGRKVLFVNRHFTTHICELPDDEGRMLLEFLIGRVNVPEVQLRVSWEPGTMVMWDNRTVQHYAPNDYFPQRRRMERVTIAGDAPIADAAPPTLEQARVEVDGVPDQPIDAPPPPARILRQFERT